MNLATFKNMNNYKYLAICLELIKEDQAPRLIHWVAELSDENKKGLRVLK